MKRRAFTMAELLIVMIVISVPLGFWSERTIEFWGGYVKGQPVDVSWWMCWALSLLSPIALLGNVISEIARAFV